MLDMATQASCALITESCKKNMIYNYCDMKKKKGKDHKHTRKHLLHFGLISIFTVEMEKITEESLRKVRQFEVYRAPIGSSIQIIKSAEQTAGHMHLFYD